MTKSSDRLTLLETFVRIAESGSISAAARDLDMSQASASRQLAMLEKIVGDRLLHRTTHSLALTEAGRTLAVDARALLAGWDEMLERYGSGEDGLRGRVKVVAPVALGQIHLSRALADFQTRHPAVSVNWILEDGPVRFAETGCDIWIKAGRPPDETLVVKTIGMVERMIVAAPDLAGGKPPRAPGDLRALPCIALSPFEGSAIPVSNGTGRTVQIAANVAQTTNNVFAARESVLGGLGFAVMPRWFVEDDLAAGTLVDLLPRWRAPSLPIALAYMPAPRRPRRIQELADWLEAAVLRLPGIAPG